ncbi:MAG: hypothetical protein JXR70_00455, partial [Spirochaetales bacterium]|nr:hypothetical protein [Spirochaetales bacterium]
MTTDYGYYDESGLVDPANGNSNINLQNTYRLESINITKGSSIIANTHYEYDRLDNILKKTYEGAHGDMEEFFSYDHQNRLVEAAQSKGRYDYTYAYSEDNNINSIVSQEVPGQNSIMGESERYYVYDAPAGDSGRTLAHAVKEIREG